MCTDKEKDLVTIECILGCAKSPISVFEQANLHLNEVVSACSVLKPLIQLSKQDTHSHQTPVFMTSGI